MNTYEDKIICSCVPKIDFLFHITIFIPDLDLNSIASFIFQFPPKLNKNTQKPKLQKSIFMVNDGRSEIIFHKNMIKQLHFRNLITQKHDSRSDMAKEDK